MIHLGYYVYFRRFAQGLFLDEGQACATESPAPAVGVALRAGLTAKRKPPLGSSPFRASIPDAGIRISVYALFRLSGFAGSDQP